MMRTWLILVQQRGWSFVGPQLLCSFAVITHFTQAAQTIEHSRDEFGGWKVSGNHKALLKVTPECLAKHPSPTPCTLYTFFLLKQSLLALRQFFSWLLPYFPTHYPLFKSNLYKMNLLFRLGSWSNTVTWDHLAFWLLNEYIFVALQGDEAMWRGALQGAGRIDWCKALEPELDQKNIS